MIYVYQIYGFMFTKNKKKKIKMLILLVDLLTAGKGMYVAVARLRHGRSS